LAFGVERFVWLSFHGGDLDAAAHQKTVVENPDPEMTVGEFRASEMASWFEKYGQDENTKFVN
jgi:hypothetical protein